MRVENWDLRLAHTLEDWSGKQFDRARADCARFVVAAIAAVSDRRVARSLIRYRTARGALKVLSREGGFDGILDKLFDQIPVTLARRGDVVTVPHGEVELGDIGSVGVCVGAQYAAMGPDGLQLGAMSDAIACWRVD